MIKPLWGLAGVALLGSAGVAGVVIVASSGGEEEVAQLVGTPWPNVAVTVTPSQAPSPPVATLTPATTAPPIREDWLSYTDPILGFSLRYPLDLVFEDLTGPPGGLKQQRALEFRSTEDHSRAIAISVYENTEGLTAEEWAMEFIACHWDTIRPATVAGRIAVICTGEGIKGLLDTGAVIEYGGSMFYISSTLTSSETEMALGSLRLDF